MGLNWTNYDRLVAHLQTIHPSTFHYGWAFRADPSDSGCVACHCRYLEDMSTAFAQWFGPEDIVRFLAVTVAEGEYLYEGEHQDDPLPAMGGPNDIANALHRLAVVASHYTRPTISEAPAVIEQADRERAFLTSCMAIASQPVETVEAECG